MQASPKPPRVLHLHLKGCYFDAIQRGEKTCEYRLASTWEPRLAGKTFDEIWLKRGYPRRNDRHRILRRKWNGYRTELRRHPHFGRAPVEVLAIDVTQRVEAES